MNTKSILEMIYNFDIGVFNEDEEILNSKINFSNSKYLVVCYSDAMEAVNHSIRTSIDSAIEDILKALTLKGIKRVIMYSREVSIKVFTDEPFTEVRINNKCYQYREGKSSNVKIKERSIEYCIVYANKVYCRTGDRKVYTIIDPIQCMDSKLFISADGNIKSSTWGEVPVGSFYYNDCLAIVDKIDKEFIDSINITSQWLEKEER